MTVLSILDTIGNTPLVELKNVGGDAIVYSRILAKVERGEPGGSVKDRVAAYMIAAAEKSGALRPGGTIIEPTSGNTGIGLSLIGAARGYGVIIVMPDNMSKERVKLMQCYGAKVVLTDGKLGMSGAIKKARELLSTVPGAFIPDQFSNHANVRAHFETTGPEIWKGAEGKVDIFVAGVGTGGTLTGVGRYLKERDPNIKVVAVEPASSPVLSEGRAGAHKIQGIGAGFVPDILDTALIDEVVTVTDDDAFSSTKRLARREGLFVGISSGAAAFAACKLAQRPENAGKTIVTLFPDGGERYLSSGLFDGD